MQDELDDVIIGFMTQYTTYYNLFPIAKDIQDRHLAKEREREREREAERKRKEEAARKAKREQYQEWLREKNEGDSALFGSIQGALHSWYVVKKENDKVLLFARAPMIEFKSCDGEIPYGILDNFYENHFNEIEKELIIPQNLKTDVAEYALYKSKKPIREYQTEDLQKKVFLFSPDEIRKNFVTHEQKKMLKSSVNCLLRERGSAPDRGYRGNHFVGVYLKPSGHIEAVWHPNPYEWRPPMYAEGYWLRPAIVVSLK